MYNTIRQKLRREIRQKQIHEFFQQRRQERLQQECEGSTYQQQCRQLQALIKAHSQAGSNAEMVEKLISMVDRHPTSENTYILVGNYLIDHMDGLSSLQDVLSHTRERRKCLNYVWVLQVMMSKDRTDKMMKFYDEEIQQLIMESSTQEESITALYTLKSLVGVGEYWPSSSIDALCGKMKGLPIHDHYEKLMLYELMCEIWKHHNCDSMLKQYLDFVLDTFHDFLDEFPTERSTLLQVLQHFITSHHHFITDGILHHPSLLTSLKYIYAHSPKYQESIMRIFLPLINSPSLHTVITVLNWGIHYLCVEGLNSEDVGVVHWCLEGIKGLLFTIECSEEEKLKEQVLSSMEEHSLEHYLAQLTERTLPGQTESVLNYIIDAYYSDT